MSISPQTPASAPLAGTGVDGLDDVLGGGLTSNQLYVIEGLPETGETTLALQFLMEARVAAKWSCT
jgi:circadian clock protein KaiC